MITDTTFVYNLNPPHKEMMDIFFQSLPLIILVLGILLNHIYTKIKTASVLKETKQQLKFSLQILETAMLQQANCINEFKKQFKASSLDFQPVTLVTHVNTKNMKSLSTKDEYKIFITRAKGTIEQKSEIYNKFNYVVSVIERCETHLEEDMNKYIRRTNDLKDQFNAHNQMFLTLMNELIKKKINKIANENEIKFITYMQQEHRKLVDSGKIDEIFYAIETFHKPLLEKAKIFNIEQIANMIPLGIGLLRQLKFTQESFYDIFNSYEIALKTSHDFIKIVLGSKTFK